MSSDLHAWGRECAGALMSGRLQAGSGGGLEARGAGSLQAWVFRSLTADELRGLKPERL